MKTHLPPNSDDEKTAENSEVNCASTLSSILSGIGCKEQLKEFKNDWILGSAVHGHDDFNTDDHVYTYSCMLQNDSMRRHKRTYQVRIVEKDANISPKMRAQMRLINQLYLDWVKISQQFHEMHPVGVSILLLDICEDDDSFYFIEVTDELNKYYFSMEDDMHIVQSEQDAKDIIITLLQTVSIMHLFGIVHLLLNRENVFISAKNRISCNVKISNYGVGCVLNCKMIKEIRDSVFVAPEVLDDEYTITPASDIWSLGVLIFCLVYGELPSKELITLLTKDNCNSNKRTTTNASFPKYNTFFEQVSQHWQDLICKMLQKDAKDRITAMEALNHPALKRAMTSDNVCCLCESLEPSVFVWDTIHRMIRTNNEQDSTGCPFSICGDLWRIYASNISLEDTEQRHKAVCACVQSKLMSNESNITEIDALISSTMMATLEMDESKVQLVLLNKISNETLNQVSVAQGTIVVSIAALLFAMSENYIKCN